MTNTDIEIKEYYAGKSETVYKAILNGQVLHQDKNKVVLIRKLAKKG